MKSSVQTATKASKSEKRHEARKSVQTHSENRNGKTERAIIPREFWKSRAIMQITGEDGRVIVPSMSGEAFDLLWERFAECYDRRQSNAANARKWVEAQPSSWDGSESHMVAVAIEPALSLTDWIRLKALAQKEGKSLDAVIANLLPLALDHADNIELP